MATSKSSGGKGGKGSAGTMDKAAKVKLGVSIALIVVSATFLASYFGVFSSPNTGPVETGMEELPPEVQEEVKRVNIEIQEEAEAEGVVPSGS